MRESTEDFKKSIPWAAARTAWPAAPDEEARTEADSHEALEDLRKASKDSKRQRSGRGRAKGDNSPPDHFLTRRRALSRELEEGGVARGPKEFHLAMTASSGISAEAKEVAEGSSSSSSSKSDGSSGSSAPPASTEGRAPASGPAPDSRIRLDDRGCLPGWVEPEGRIGP